MAPPVVQTYEKAGRNTGLRAANVCRGAWARRLSVHTVAVTGPTVTASVRPVAASVFGGAASGGATDLARKAGALAGFAEVA